MGLKAMCEILVSVWAHSFGTMPLTKFFDTMFLTGLGNLISGSAMCTTFVFMP